MLGSFEVSAENKNLHKTKTKFLKMVITIFFSGCSLKCTPSLKGLHRKFY